MLYWSVMLVMHAWLPNFVTAQKLLVECLVRPADPDLVPPKKRTRTTRTSKLLEVEFAFSGKHLTSIPADLPACSADTASFVANLQDQIAKKLDEIAPVGCTTLGHDVRLFCGHNGPELTWPELALLPHQPNQPNQPYLLPAESQTALARLASGSVLVAVRSDVGSQALTRFRTQCVSVWARQDITAETTTLMNNALPGPICPALCYMANMTHVTLRNVRLSGSICTEFGLMVNLVHLKLHQNRLTGNIPTEFGQLINMQYLALDWNLLTGSIPTELGKLVNMTHLLMTSNKLNGSIPTELGQLTNVKVLFLGRNQLDGTLPMELGNCIKLTRFSYDWYNFSNAEEFNTYFRSRVKGLTKC